MEITELTYKIKQFLNESNYMESTYTATNYSDEKYEELQEFFNDQVLPIWNDKWHNKFVMLLENYEYDITIDTKITNLEEHKPLISTALKEDIVDNKIEISTGNMVFYNFLRDERKTLLPGSICILFKILAPTATAGHYVNILNDERFADRLGRTGYIMSGKDGKNTYQASKANISIEDMDNMSQAQLIRSFNDQIQFMYEYLQDCLAQIQEKTDRS